jgi:hypothetical protein
VLWALSSLCGGSRRTRLAEPAWQPWSTVGGRRRAVRTAADECWVPSRSSSSRSATSEAAVPCTAARALRSSPSRRRARGAESRRQRRRSDPRAGGPGRGSVPCDASAQPKGTGRVRHAPVASGLTLDTEPIGTGVPGVADLDERDEATLPSSWQRGPMLRVSQSSRESTGSGRGLRRGCWEGRRPDLEHARR